MFIYVFSEKDCETLKKAGFALITKDEAAKAWVFDDAGGNYGVLKDVDAVRSNRLNF